MYERDHVIRLQALLRHQDRDHTLCLPSAELKGKWLVRLQLPHRYQWLRERRL